MLYSDEAITKKEDDLLGRDKFAKYTAQALRKIANDGTYTVGLFGKWGAGKTSLLNMILQEIRTAEDELNQNEQTIIVHFEPWNFSSTDQLLSQFFIHLITEFDSKKDSKLAQAAEAIQKYSFAFELAKLIPLAGEHISGALKGGAELLSNRTSHGANEEDITKQRDNVIKILTELDRKLLIVIDDIDRLSNEQIRCVFQLITSVARFPKTTYLLAFDKDIVVKALEEVQKGKGEDYLEKIIQVPIQLPYVKSGKIREILFSRLNEVIGENPEMHFNSKHWQKLFPICVDPFIKTLRDVNRLCNALRFKLQAIPEEIDFTDMTAITLLEINYPAIYEWILCNKDVLTGEYSYRLRGSRDWKREKWDKLTRDQWAAILENESRDSLETVTDAVFALFPAVADKVGPFYAGGYNDDVLRRENRIGHRDKFDRYFQLSLNDNSVSNTDIINVLELFDEVGLINFLDEIDGAGKSYDLLQELRAHIPDISSERAKIIIKALFCRSAAFDKTPHGYASLSSSREAQFLLLKLFEIIPEEERYPFLLNIMREADSITMEAIADFLNMQELAHGRLAANGKQSSSAKVISDDELHEFESAFTEKIKELIIEKPLFEFDNCEMIIYLLEYFDSDYIKRYLTECFSDSSNILRFLEYSPFKWTGTGVGYVIQDKYKKYISDTQITSAIEQCRANGKLASLPESVQIMSAVYWLHFHNQLDYAKYVPEKEARQLLTEWNL